MTMLARIARRQRPDRMDIVEPVARRAPPAACGFAWLADKQPLLGNRTSGASLKTRRESATQGLVGQTFLSAGIVAIFAADRNVCPTVLRTAARRRGLGNRPRLAYNAGMSNDLSRILDDWKFQPDEVMVRIVPGDDGRSKIQLRVDLGILQMEMDGRPDGFRPEGFESWLDYYEHQQQLHDERIPIRPPSC